MDLHIFTPNRSALFNEALENQLKSEFSLKFHEDPSNLQPIENIEAEKIVALDPDLFGWKFTASDIDALGPTKAICLQTTSFSWIDTGHAKNKGIPVTNLRGFSTDSVAEYALLLALGVARKIALVTQDDFIQDFVKHQGMEFKGKRAGIVGLGQIGRRIADIMHGIGMNVSYWSANTRAADYNFLDIKELFSTSDVVFVCLASNSDTQTLIQDDMITSMKKDAMLISIAHAVYNHDLVISQVQNGHLYGYGFEADNASPIQHKGNIYALPAIGWATRECMATNAQAWVKAMIAAKNNEYPNLINP